MQLALAGVETPVKGQQERRLETWAGPVHHERPEEPSTWMTRRKVCGKGAEGSIPQFKFLDDLSG